MQIWRSLSIARKYWRLVVAICLTSGLICFCATMRLAAESSGVVDCSGGESTAAAGEEGGAVVVVGVKVDSRTKELLTWALVKVAQSGDRVIALHVLDPNVEKSDLLSLVKTFDSMLAAYEGFCNLKQSCRWIGLRSHGNRYTWCHYSRQLAASLP